MRKLPPFTHLASEQSPLDRAKDRLRIPELWHRIGLGPDEPSKSCRSPLRPDNSASFSVSPDGLLWHDFGEGTGGDAVDFLARAAGLDKAEACRRFIAMAGTANAPKPKASPAKKRQPPKLEPWTVQDSMKLARLRSWPTFAGLEIAARRGLLGIVQARDGDGPPVRCYAVTDAAGAVIQLRRMDGEPFAHRWDGTAKSWKPCEPFKSKTLTAGTAGAGWPVGAANLSEGRAVILCEGGPDFLAAFGLAFLAGKSESLDVVAMLGASNRIDSEALPKFTSKRIRIFRQADDAGTVAADKWAAQLRSVGAEVDFVTVSGDSVADAADVLASLRTAPESETPNKLFAGIGGEQSE